MTLDFLPEFTGERVLLLLNGAPPWRLAPPESTFRGFAGEGHELPQRLEVLYLGTLPEVSLKYE